MGYLHWWERRPSFVSNQKCRNHQGAIAWLNNVGEYWFWWKGKNYQKDPYFWIGIDSYWIVSNNQHSIDELLNRLKSVYNFYPHLCGDHNYKFHNIVNNHLCLSLWKRIHKIWVIGEYWTQNCSESDSQ